MTPTIRSSTLANNSSKFQRNEDRIELSLNYANIHVWSIEFQEHFHELFKRFRSMISDDEFAKAKRLHRANDFKRYFTGRIVLRILLGRYLTRHPTEISFDSFNGKLYLPDSPLKFNVSYSNKHIILSFGYCDTGIDIEQINFDFDLRDMLHACFSQNEIENIVSDDDKLKDRFFLQWTRKEALLKYTGQGIIDDLAAIPSLDGFHDIISSKLNIKSDLNLISFRPQHDLVASLAYPTSIKKVEFFTWQS